jgi:superfamily I DNA/RNA helicase
MTLHAAKGLEWKAVYVIGACQPNFPDPRSRDTSSAYEEERRLMYAGMASCDGVGQKKAPPVVRGG